MPRQDVPDKHSKTIVMLTEYPAGTEVLEQTNKSKLVEALERLAVKRSGRRQVETPSPRHREVVSKWWPNGESTMGFVPPKRKEGKAPGEKGFDRDHRAHQQHLEAVKQAESNYSLAGGLTQAQRLAMASVDYPSHEKTLAERKERSERTPPKRKGLNGITGRGSKMVRSSCYLLQGEFGKERLGFLTLTLPDNRDYLPILSQRKAWPELVRKFCQKLMRKLRKLGAPCYYIQVTEIQEKRSRATGLLIPHLHLVYVAWDGKSYQADGRKEFYLSHSWLQEAWQSVLENSLKTWEAWIEGSSLDKARVSIETVKKNVEGYLGKYMTKGKKSLNKLIKDGFSVSEIPCQWWGCNKDMREKVKSSIQSLPDDIVTTVLQGVDLVARGVARYLHEVKVTLKREGEAVEKTVGYALRLVESWNKSLRTETG